MDDEPPTAIRLHRLAAGIEPDATVTMPTPPDDTTSYEFVGNVAEVTKLSGCAVPVTLVTTTRQPKQQENRS